MEDGGPREWPSQRQRRSHMGQWEETRGDDVCIRCGIGGGRWEEVVAAQRIME